jgi:hypothetical protein
MGNQLLSSSDEELLLDALFPARATGRPAP